MVAVIIGSIIVHGGNVGQFGRVFHVDFFAVFRITSYTTVGAVVIKSMSNSRSKRSCTISKCSKPKKPQRKPKPNAWDTSGSNFSEASFELQFFQRVAQGFVIVAFPRDTGRRTLGFALL